MLIRYRGYMSFKKLSLHSYAGPLLCTLISVGLFGQVAKADFADITLTVDSTDARGFYLSSASSDYVKKRDQAGIPDKNGGTTKSLNASLTNSGDVWRAEIKAEDLNAGGRVLGKLHDIESLSYEVWHDAKGNYPQLSILIDRLDGERAEALY